MNLTVKRVNVWAAGIKDKPGAVSRVLKGLHEAGADLDFIIARRTQEEPGTGVIFLTPIRGDREVSAASLLGFNLTSSVASIRVEGDNRPGAASQVAGWISDADINVKGFSAAVIGPRFMAYFGFDSVEDAKRAVEVLEMQDAEAPLV